MSVDAAVGVLTLPGRDKVGRTEIIGEKDKRQLDQLRKQLDEESIYLGMQAKIFRREVSMGNYSPEWAFKGTEVRLIHGLIPGKTVAYCVGGVPANEYEQEKGFDATPIRWMIAVDAAAEAELKGMKGDKFFKEMIMPKLLNGERNLVAMTHGWGGSGAVMSTFMTGLEEGQVMLSMSTIGSEGAANGKKYGFDSCVAQVESVFNALNSQFGRNGVGFMQRKLESLWGHSMGGMTVLKFAAKEAANYPEATFVAAMPVVNNETEHLKLIHEKSLNGLLVSLLTRRLPAKAAELFLKLGNELRINKAVFESFFNENPSLMVLAAHLNSLKDEPNFLRRASKMLTQANLTVEEKESLKVAAANGQVLMVEGEADQVLDREQMTALAQETGIPVVEGKNCGHYPDARVLRKIREAINFLKGEKKWRKLGGASAG